MSVKNVTADDVALIELASGRATGAPSAVLQRLAARGYLATGGKTLTAKGRRRGERLAGMEHDLRLMAANAAGSGNGGVQTVGGSTFTIGGGAARIN